VRRYPGKYTGTLPGIGASPLPGSGSGPEFEAERRSLRNDAAVLSRQLGDIDFKIIFLARREEGSASVAAATADNALQKIYRKVDNKGIASRPSAAEQKNY
jgi:hypothetical protein